MKKFAKVAAVVLSAAMVVGSFAGCTTTGTTDPTKADATKATNDETKAVDNGTTAAPAAEEGTVLNIRAWNTEFLERLVAYYPNFEAADADDITKGGKIGDVTVNFSIVANQGNAYQDALDEALSKQADADADEKVDLFLVEADYALKYVDTDATMALEDLGITADDLSDQYSYTQDIVTDSNGKLKGSSWQGCPGALIYRADIAKEVLGTDDPAEVQEYVKDWSAFADTAEKMAAKGYNITATVNDTFRVFSNNVTSKWVVDGVINVDDNIKAWVDMSKAMVDAKQTTTEALWSDTWAAGFFKEGAYTNAESGNTTSGNKVFCYFGPAWMIDFSMHSDEDGSVGKEGGWRITEGPQGFFWGGTWICAATGTDNPTLVGDIIKTMTSNDDVLTKIITEKNDFVNDSALIEKYASDENFGNKILGGQNGLAVFSKGVSSVDLSNLSIYDQGCNEAFQNAMKDYFEGNYSTYEDALAAFYKAVIEKYPNLTAPQ